MVYRRLADTQNLWCDCTMTQPDKGHFQPTPTNQGREVVNEEVARLPVPSSGKSSLLSSESDVRVAASIAEGPFSQYGIDSGAAVQILKIGISAAELGWASTRLGINKAHIAHFVGIDRTTAARLAANKKPLPLHAAERLLRMVELDTIACETFESAEAARGWLIQQHPMLGSESPFQAAKTSYGAMQVKDLLASIKYSGAV